MMDNIAKILFLAVVFLLALCRIEDPDAWIHLMNGKLIWSAQSIPATEPYVYSMLGRPYLYTSWLFGTFYFMVYRFFDIGGVILAKAAVITLTFFFMLRTALRGHNNLVVVLLVLFGIALVTRHRFTERPDTVLFLVLSFTVFALESFIAGDKRYVYALPFVHLVWANVHTSINLMFLPFLAFAVGGAIERYLRRPEGAGTPAPDARQLKSLVLIGALSFVASLVNPNHLGQYLLGVGFYQNEWFRQNILELAPPAWSTAKEFYVVAALLCFVALLNWRRVSPIELILVVPLLVLAFTSRRFMYPFFIVAGPVIARNLSGALRLSWPSMKGGVKKAALAAVVLLLVLSTSLTLAHIKPFGNDDKEFGFGLNPLLVPEAALRYMDEQHITGRVLNSFHWGQYIAWRDYPKRSVISDGRFNVPRDLLENVSQAPLDPAVLDRLYRLYGFEAILIDYSYEEQPPRVAGKESFDARMYHPGWALVYWDDLSLVYVRRDGPYGAVATRDEYRFVKPANNLNRLVARLGNEQDRAAILQELKRNTETTGSVSGWVYRGHVNNVLGRYPEAVASFAHVRDHPLKHYLSFAQKGMGYAYEMLGDHASALEHYELSYNQRRDPVIKAKIQELRNESRKQS